MFRVGPALVAVFVLASAARADDFRTWSDTTGKFSVRAKFVSQADGKVTLEKPDGTTVEIPLLKLSVADRTFVRNIKKTDPDDPFQEKPKPGAGPAEGEAKELAPDLSKARVVGVSAAPDKWAVAAGPAPAAAGELSADPVPLPAKGGFWENVKGLAVSGPARKAVVGYAFTEPGKKDGTSRVVVCDLATGKRAGGGTAAGAFAPLALADDGVRLVVRTDGFGGGTQDKLELWSVDGAGVKRLIRWSPHDDLKNHERDVKWAAFAGPDRLLTAGASGRVTAWDLPACEPVYQLQTHAGSVPALSPDRKLLAFSTDKDVGVLDVAAGKVVAIRPAPPAFQAFLAFSPSGKRLARLGMDKLTVWNAETGERERDIGTLGVHAQSPPVWPTDDHVLVGGRILVDVESQVKLWEYQGAEFVQPLGGVCWFVAVDGERPGALVPARVPAGGAKEKLEEALARPDFFVLKPGTAVRLSVDGITDAAERDKAGRALADKLRANGCAVDPAGTIELVALTEVGKQQELNYRSFGAFGAKTYKFQEHYCKVRFVTGGKTAWESAAGNHPGFMVHLAEGETMEQHLQKRERPNYAFFQGVELPKLLTKPTGAQALGSSRVTTAGVR